MQTMTRTPTLRSDDPTAFGATRGAEEHRGSGLPPEMQFALLYWFDAYGTSGLQFAAPVRLLATTSTDNRIIEFKTLSCLTWPQIARLFGVSKRAVLLWQAGGQMSAAHEERLTELLSRLRHAPSNEPIETRAWLMTIDDHGTAPYQRWVEEATSRKREPWIDRQPVSR